MQTADRTNGGARPNAYTCVAEILAPVNEKWEPERAQQLATSLFSLRDLFKLVIQADRSSIRWLIEVPCRHKNAVIQSLYASYPRAQISVEASTRVLIGYYTYHYHTAGPFVGPLLYAENFKLDPLATLVGAMTDLALDEVVVYELELQDIRQAHFDLGAKIDIDSYAGPLRRLMSEKLYGPLKQVALAAKIRAASRTRAYDLVRSLSPGLALLERPTSNLLVPAQSESYPLVLSPREVAALWHLPSDECRVPGITWAAAISTPVPASVSNQEQGICLGSNLYRGQAQPVWLSYRDRVTHVNVIGKTGAGKSTLLHNMIHQDIQAGKGVAVIDPHGDLVDQVLATSIPEAREKDVILFDLSDTQYPIGLNFLAAPDNISRATVADMTLAVIRKMFAESWSATRMEDSLYAALLALQSVEGATIRDVARLFNNSGYRAKVLAEITDPVVLEFWYEDYEQLSASYQREIARPIINRIRKFYRNEKIGRIVAQSNCLDFTSIIGSDSIFLGNLTGISEIEAETLGALLISKFQLAAMSRVALSPDKRNPYYLYIDEVQSLAATSLDVLFSEARKTGLSLVVANQFLDQLQGPILEAIMGNVGTTIMFGVGPKDAKTLAPFVRPQITSDELMNLDRFNTVVRMQQDGRTQPAFSIQTPPPLPVPEDARARVQRIQNLSRRAYARRKDEVDAELLARYQHYQQRARAQAESEGEESYFG